MVERVWLANGRRFILVLVVATGLGIGSVWSADNTSAIDQRILADVRYLASDELEGRGIDTAGIDKAADHIARQFERIGLKGAVGGSGYAQPFKVRIASKVNSAETRLHLAGPSGQPLRLELGKDYQPLANDGLGEFQAPVIFAGYGITSEKLKYDDYRGIDARGKIVLVLRREPQQADLKSVFNGTAATEYAGLSSKLANAQHHGAAAVLLVSDPFSVTKPEQDGLLAANYLGLDASAALPVAHVTQDVGNKLLAATKLKSLKDAESAIDAALEPVSQPVAGWSAEGRFSFERLDTNLRNVAGVLPGAGDRAEETIVVGAHYDHLGYGGPGSGSLGGGKEIHNGADDNASGTAALIELARRVASRGPPPV